MDKKRAEIINKVDRISPDKKTMNKSNSTIKFNDSSNQLSRCSSATNINLTKLREKQFGI